MNDLSRRQSRVVTALLGVLPSVVALVVALVLLWLWRDELPARVATHWGSDGVDGTTSIPGVVVAVVLTAAIAALVGGLAGWYVDETRLLRLVLALINGGAVFVVTGIVAILGTQRRATAVDDVDAPVVALALAGVLGVIVAIVTVALIRPRNAPTPAPLGEQPMAQLAEGERFLWQRRVSASTGSMVVLGLVLLAVVVISVLLSDPWLVAPGIVVAVAVVMVWSARVSVDRERISVRGIIGWPRLGIPMEDVVRAEVTNVSALRDFGGYGQRICVHGRLRGARGIVLRSGPALVITRSDGSRDLVVVPDADVAAGLVNASVAQAHSHR
ncbi:hypothetical protein [Gordonia aichiensis]|uniref:DUF1648 domain-containing protein n=1 Tax=Gordonia aichiensis NBRC 108223 TaxID=1220583 RepID=L7KM51_9ACTN|nr:hypothetical protein [Gordonia aichiensis]GAC49012.1 hypothetical protein GOACH_08_00750 [Gordonia aichiensis NBRC 108223]